MNESVLKQCPIDQKVVLMSEDKHMITITSVLPSNGLELSVLMNRLAISTGLSASHPPKMESIRISRGEQVIDAFKVTYEIPFNGTLEQFKKIVSFIEEECSSKN
jgi:hypothetical protein